jgi:hypothetical protein
MSGVLKLVGATSGAGLPYNALIGNRTCAERRYPAFIRQASDTRMNYGFHEGEIL